MNHMKIMTLLAALTALLVWAGTALAGQNGFVMALVLAGVQLSADPQWAWPAGVRGLPVPRRIRRPL
jgi:hypothetical protein